MKKYKYYNNTNGVVQSATRNNITNKVEVVVKVSSGQLGVSTSEVYPITFMAMDDTLFTGFSESCTYNASTDEYTLFFPGTSISEETIAKFMYPSAEWELRVTQTELNELFNEVYQLTGNLVTTPEITGPDAPIVYQGTYANEYSFTASPTLAGNTISSFLVDVSGIGTQVITAADNAGTYTLKIPTTISAGTKLDMYVTATDSQGWKSSPAYKQLTVVAPYVKVPTVVKPTEGQEVIAINFDIQSSTFATEGLADTCSKTEFQIQNNAGATVYTKELTGATYTATITDANLQRGVLYRIRCRQFGTTLTTPSAWSAFVSFRTADIYIQAPTVISPVTGNQIFKYNVVISGNPFAVVGGGTDTHAASQYRVQNTLGTNIYDSGEKTDALTSITIPELTEAVVGESYKISVRYKGTTYGWSDWATAVTVSIKSAYVNAPVLTAPTQNAQIKGTTVAFVQQGFSSTGTSDTQNGVQYQLLKADNSVYYDSGELTTDYAAHTAEITRPAVEIALRARARNKGTNLGWSAWSEYVNITVSPSLHLTLSDDGKLLYVGKPDGTPFDRPDGTFYWLGVDTVNTVLVGNSGSVANNFYVTNSPGMYVYDTVVSSRFNLQDIKDDPSKIDNMLCKLDSTQDGEYSTYFGLAAGVPSSGDAKTNNDFMIARGTNKNTSTGKLTHLPSKRELLYLLIQQDAVDAVAGTGFFNTHVGASPTGGYNLLTCTFNSSTSILVLNNVQGGQVYDIATLNKGQSILSITNYNLSTINCDSLGMILPDRHGTTYEHDQSYTYYGHGANMPFFDNYGRRFWAAVSSDYIATNQTEDVCDVTKQSNTFTSSKLNGQTSTTSRGNYLYNVYPFQLRAAGIADVKWFMNSRASSKTVSNTPTIVSPLVLLGMCSTLSNFNMPYSSSLLYKPTTRYYSMIVSDSIKKEVISVSFSLPRALHLFLHYVEYLPSDTGRKLYRHSSGMGTVMEYTDADGIRKSVLILDAAYRQAATKMSSVAACPSTLKPLFTVAGRTEIKNVLGQASVLPSGVPVASENFLNALWPASIVDPNSSAYNTQQWLTLAQNPSAATAANNIKVAGVGCQIPNFNVAMRIYLERDTLDALDPSVTSYIDRALGKANPGGVFGMGTHIAGLTTSSCGQEDNGYVVTLNSAGGTTGHPATESYSVYPVLELAA